MIFSVKNQSKSSVAPVCSHHDISLSFTPIFKATGHVSALGITWLRCPVRRYWQKKGHGSATKLESKSSLFPSHSFHLDSDISLYTSFECQVKCTSNLESAQSVTVHRITVQILIAAATVQLLK